VGFEGRGRLPTKEGKGVRGVPGWVQQKIVRVGAGNIVSKKKREE